MMNHGEEQLVDDFDLFWGMGPSRSNNNNFGERHTSPPSTGRTLNPNLMGALWSHGTMLESYGHRHHVHAKTDALKDGSLGAASPPTSHRSTWLPPPSPSPVRSGDLSRRGSPGPVHRQQQHVAKGPANSTGSLLQSGSGQIGVVDSKLEELAAVISASLVDKLEPEVRNLLLEKQPLSLHQHQQQHQQQHQPCAAVASPSLSPSSPRTHAQQEEAAGRAVEAVAAPLRSRVAYLEEQVLDLKATLERNAGATDATLGAGASQPQRLNSNEQQQGDRGSTRGSSDGMVGQSSRASAHADSKGGTRTAPGGGSGGASGSPLEQSIAALAQRTGTLEGRHKQVQAKVALLDNAFGPKATDWAQTIKSILLERESVSAGGGVQSVGGVPGKASGVRPSHKGVKKTNAGGAPDKSAHKGGLEACGRHGEDFVARRSRTTTTAVAAAGGDQNRPLHRHERQIVQELGHPPRDRRKVDGNECGITRHSLLHDQPNIDRSGTSVDGVATLSTDPKPGVLVSEESGSIPSATRIVPASTSEPTPAANRCERCAQVEERCGRLEMRVTQSEEALKEFQPKLDTAAETAKMAAGAARALEVEVAGRAASTGKSEVDGSDNQQQRISGGGNWASKTALERLVGDLKQLSQRTRDSEDALALVDHGLKGVRDEIAPLAGSLTALKKLVEVHLREKEQAAEMLKGYITIISREVSTITRQYINNIISPARKTPAAEMSTSSRLPGAPLRGVVLCTLEQGGVKPGTTSPAAAEASTVDVDATDEGVIERHTGKTSASDSEASGFKVP